VAAFGMNPNIPGSHGRVQTVVAGPSPAQLQEHQQQQKQRQKQQQQQHSGKSKGKPKGLKAEEEKVSSIFREKKQPDNEFERWCHGALQSLNAQVDIPTFMAFLQDIDSPYEVTDYVKSYIGEGKSANKFAKEYLERRSRSRNAAKQRRQYEDDLLTPAAAVNPNAGADSDFVPVTNAVNQNKGAGGEGKQRRAKKQKGRPADASFLLGFNVSSERVNAGEIDSGN